MKRPRNPRFLNPILWVKLPLFILASGSIKILLQFISFEKIAPRLGCQNQQDLGWVTPKQQKIIHQLQDLLQLTRIVVPWGNNCLNHALIGKAVLNHKKIDSTLHLGVLTSPSQYKKTLQGHAWLTVGRQMVCGQSNKDYSYLTCFH